MKRIFIAVITIILAGIAGADELKPTTRSFYMGFTRWPADMTIAGILTSKDFCDRHGDILEVMFNGGIPWPEALANKPYSKSVKEKMNNRRPNGQKLFLAISPLNMDRKAMALYWGEKENMPLPREWQQAAFNSPEVKKAYLNFVMQAVEAMKPDYLAIGVENNLLLSSSPEKWRELAELHRETYSAVKAKYPQLPVFFTTAIVHYLGLAPEAKKNVQENEVGALMKYSDIFAMSFYPHLCNKVPRPLPDNFFDFARKFNKPIAVSESGDSSQDVKLKAYGITLKGSEENQRQFTEMLLRTATKDRYAFVITFATTDYEKLCQRLPSPACDLARMWAYTGMQTSERKPKPALAVWDTYLRASKTP